ncbi:MAG: hypothetical protein ACR2J1_08760 [Methyloceanibacter sp.]|uniref:hypothetical protein n=1 Tax=Methyloceanibacter sp. TaxID=1965321 RepID=UPI003D9BDC9E
MWRSITVLASAMCLVVGAADAGNKKLPCGDYDGVPSHNDGAPVSPQKEAKCQPFLDQHNATTDQKIKDKTKKKYISCVRH